MAPRRPSLDRLCALLSAIALLPALLAGCAGALDPAARASASPPLGDGSGAHMAITGTRWLWVAATTAGGAGAPPPEQLYWIHFDNAQRASIQADCNRGFADIRVAAGGLSFPRVALTRRACGTQSLDDRFVRLFESVTGAYVEDGRLKLTLDLAVGGPAGVLEFARMTPTPYACDGERQFVIWAIAGAQDLVFELEGVSTRLTPTTSGAGLRYESTAAGGPAPIELRVDGRAATASGPGFELGRCRMAPTAQAW